jgi:pyruvate/2-oxoglutarate dehydrogenase complex dihydrolipoamide dehydrogenase (E3) component
MLISSSVENSGDCLLYAVGRQARTQGLGLENVNLSTDKRGLLAVTEHYQTDVDYIYAAGDCIGTTECLSNS